MAMRTPYIVALTAVFLVAAFLLPPMPQPLDYHDFADDWALFGIANFLDVTSNLGFLLVATTGS